MYSAPQPTAPSVPSEPAAAESSSSPSLDSLALGPGDMLVSSSMSRSVGPRGQASIGAFNREYRLVDVDTWRCTHCNLTARDTPIIRKGPLGAHVRAQCFLPPPFPLIFFFYLCQNRLYATPAASTLAPRTSCPPTASTSTASLRRRRRPLCWPRLRAATWRSTPALRSMRAAVVVVAL